MKIKRLLKVIFSTVGIIFVLCFFLFAGYIIKISFFNGFGWEHNKILFQDNYYSFIDHKTKNPGKCESLTQENIDILNTSLQKFFYSGDKKYWCDLEILKIDNLKFDLGSRKDLVVENFIIPKEILLLENLHTLTLSWTDISQIKKDFSKLHNLVNLTLINPVIQTNIPESIFELPNLRYLSLQEAGFTGTLSPNFKNLEKLRKLTLLRTSLSGEIPDEIFQLPELTEIFMTENQFSGDAQQLQEKLKNIKKYYISNNKFIGDFPGDISELQRFHP